MKITPKFIDDACRHGLLVWTGNRQAISGCQLEVKGVRAGQGKVWICHQDSREWEQVSLTNIVIENRKGAIMPAGKGRPGAVTHINRSKDANAKPPRVEEVEVEEPVEPDEALLKARELLKEGGVRLKKEEADGQLIMPGQEKKVHTAIEAQALRMNKAQIAKGRATRKFNEERDILTKMMLEADTQSMDLPHDLIAEIDREPKAVVHKKKQPKNIRTQPQEEVGDEEEVE